MGAADSPWVVAVTYGRRLLVAERDEAEEFAHAQQRLQVVLERAVRHACRTSQHATSQYGKEQQTTYMY